MRPWHNRNVEQKENEKQLSDAQTANIKQKFPMVVYIK